MRKRNHHPSGNSWIKELIVCTLLCLVTGLPAAAQRAGEVDMTFDNESNFALTLRRIQPQPAQDFPPLEAGEARPVPVKIGDVLTVTSENPKYLHRTIYINHLNRNRIGLLPKKPLDDLDQRWFQTNPSLDIEGNLRAYDIRTFDPGAVAQSSRKQLFQGMDFGGAWVDYQTRANVLLPVGFDYTGSDNLGRGTTRSSEIYGSNSFMEQWNVDVGVTVPAKAVQIKGGFSYGEKKTTTNTSNDVFFYTDGKVTSYTVTTEPEKAFLNREFIGDVAGIRDLNDARELVDDYGTHYGGVVEYGARRTAYVVIKETAYLHAKETNLNLNIAVESALQGKKTTLKGPTGAYEEEKSKQAGGQGSIGFSRTTQTQEEEIVKNSESYYYAYGGDGDLSGDFWTNEDNAVPVKVELRELHELLRPEVFKNEMTAADLDQKKSWVEQAIVEVFNSCTQGINAANPPCRYGPIPQVPKKRGFRYRLKKVEILEEVDDLSREVKGQFGVAITGGSSPQNQTLWTSSSQFVADPRSGWANPSTWYQVEQLPDANGNYGPLTMSFSGELIDNDALVDADCPVPGAWCDDRIVLAPTNRAVEIGNVATLQDFSFEMSHFASWAERTKLKVTVQVQALPWAGNQQLSTYQTSVRSGSNVATSAPPVPEVTFTLPPSLTAESAPPSTPPPTPTPAPAPAPVDVAASADGRILRLQNSWYKDRYIHNQNGKIEVGPIQPNWWSAQWKIVPDPNGWVRIQNRWYPDRYIHNQNGEIEVGPIQPNWWSAQWKVVPAHSGWVRIQNRWYPDRYIHNQNGKLEVGPIQPNWASALWKLE